MLQVVLLGGSKVFKMFPVLGNLVRTIYLSLLLPVYFKMIALLTKTKFRVIYRHSVLHKNFNPCLSDIDYSLIISEPSSEKLDVLVKYLGKKLRLKILDIPQIYLENEWSDLPDIDDKKMRVIRFFWYFRKQRWINEVVPQTSYETFKKELSNATINQEIFKYGKSKNVFHFSDLLLDFPVSGGPEVCFFSPYLELKDARRVMICGSKEYEFLLSILPFERPITDLPEEWIKIKKSLWKFEYLVSRSHFRVHLRLGEPCHRYKDLLRVLEQEYEGIFNEKLTASGEEFDYTP